MAGFAFAVLARVGAAKFAREISAVLKPAVGVSAKRR